jgi:hypothetical protein
VLAVSTGNLETIQLLWVAYSIRSAPYCDCMSNTEPYCPMCYDLLRDDTCVFLSQSGETADTLRALEYAKVSASCPAHSTPQPATQ